jgi:hypothetical protein
MPNKSRKVFCISHTSTDPAIKYGKDPAVGSHEVEDEESPSYPISRSVSFSGRNCSPALARQHPHACASGRPCLAAA